MFECLMIFYAFSFMVIVSTLVYFLHMAKSYLEILESSYSLNKNFIFFLCCSISFLLTLNIFKFDIMQSLLVYLEARKENFKLDLEPDILLPNLTLIYLNKFTPFLLTATVVVVVSFLAQEGAAEEGDGEEGEVGDEELRKMDTFDLPPSCIESVRGSIQSDSHLLKVSPLDQGVFDPGHEKVIIEEEDSK